MLFFIQFKFNGPFRQHHLFGLHRKFLFPFCFLGKLCINHTVCFPYWRLFYNRFSSFGFYKVQIHLVQHPVYLCCIIGKHHDFCGLGIFLIPDDHIQQPSGFGFPGKLPQPVMGNGEKLHCPLFL